MEVNCYEEYVRDECHTESVWVQDPDPQPGTGEGSEEIISQIKMNVLMGHQIAREGVIARVVRFVKVLVNVKFVILIHVNVFEI